MQLSGFYQYVIKTDLANIKRADYSFASSFIFAVEEIQITELMYKLKTSCRDVDLFLPEW